MGLLALLLGAKDATTKLLVTKRQISHSNATRSKGIATRNKDATRGSW